MPQRQSQQRVSSSHNDRAKPFVVEAGKIEHDGSRNYKYMDQFATLAEAQVAVAQCPGLTSATWMIRAWSGIWR